MLHITVNKKVERPRNLCYTDIVALGKQLPIRLETEIEKRLEKAAARAGTTKSAIVRLLVRSFVEQVVQQDGTVHLPPNWADLLPYADKRSIRVKVGRGGVAQTVGSGTAVFRESDDSTGVPTRHARVRAAKRKK